MRKVLMMMRVRMMTILVMKIHLSQIYLTMVMIKMPFPSLSSAEQCQLCIGVAVDVCTVYCFIAHYYGCIAFECIKMLQCIVLLAGFPHWER